MTVNIGKISTYLSVIGTLIGGLIYVAVWYSTTIATKDDLSVMYTELRLHQIEESLLRYQERGINTLSDTERHRYESLVKAESNINSKRNKLLGLE